MKKLHILMLSAAFLFSGCKATEQPISTCSTKRDLDFSGEIMLACSVGIGAASLAFAYMGKKVNEIFKTETDLEQTLSICGKGNSWSPGDCLLSASKITGRFAYVTTWLTILFPLFVHHKKTA